MAYFYGNGVNHWRAYGNVATENRSGSVTRVTLVAGMQATGWGFDISYVDATATVNGQSTTTYDNDFYSPSGGWAAVDMATKTLDITRDHSAKTINVSVRIVNSSSYMDGTSTASSTVTIPARASYSVSYNANGGTGAPVSQYKWHDETLTLSTTKPTRSGYSFQGWATSSGGSVAYAAGASYTANAAVTLYAVWAASSWTVAYNANGGTSTPSSQTKQYNVALKLANAITHNDTSVSYTVTYNANGGSSTGASNNRQTATTTTTYTFSVWKATDGKTYSGGANYTANAATTMTAQWSTSASGGTVTLPTPTWAGHNFNGWYNGSTRVGGAGGTYRPTANVTLKASWTIQTWTVSYNANGGSGAPSSQTKVYGTTLTLSSTEPRRSGYTFLGWSTNSSGTGTAYAAGGNYTANAAATLYAVWVAVQVTSVSGYRCESDGTKADSGTYGHVEASVRGMGTIAGTLTASATANGEAVTSSLSPTSGSKTATADLTITPTGTFGGSYSASTSITVMVTATLSVSYGGSTRTVTAQRGMVIPKPFRIMDFVHGTAYDGFTEGAAIGSVATLVGRFEVALQSVFRKPLELMQSTFGRDEDVSTPTDGDVKLNFRDRASLLLGYLSVHKNQDGTNYIRLTGVGPDSGITANLYLGSDGTKRKIGTDAIWYTQVTTDTTAVVVRDSRFNRDGTVSSDVWSTVHGFQDVDGENIGYLQAYQLTNGAVGIQMYTVAEDSNGGTYSNYIRASVDKSGNKAYSVGDAAAFRSAIGAASTDTTGAINALASTSTQQWRVQAKVNNSSNTARNGHYTWLVMNNGSCSCWDATSSETLWTTYTTANKPTPAAIGALSDVTVSTKTVSLPANTSAVSVTAPTVSGYTFVCWLQPAGSGHTNPAYMESVNSATTNLYSANGTTTAARSYKCAALYKKS